MTELIDKLKQSLNKGFIDRDHIGSVLDPKLLVNNEEKKEFLVNILQDDLAKSKRFFFSVAFITQSGLDDLKTQLADLAKKGVEGKLITSTYADFNHPDTFEALLKIPNLSVHISRKKGFHSKGYVFDYGEYQSMIVGSSNLTSQALKQNYEWNVRFTTLDHGEIIYQTLHHLEDEWAVSDELTPEWVFEYRKNYRLPFMNPVDVTIDDDFDIENEYIVPNKMQRGALDSLKDVRTAGQEKAIVISATGTGKTYLAAFDVLNVGVERLLFVVHREQIIDDAIESFKRILGGRDADYGKLTGTHKDYESKYLFTTNMSIASDKNLQHFAKDTFDYIIIDEAHRSGADTYTKIIDYFEPDFLLGITATPERTDDFNVFALFDYNIAYEIRLQDALEADMLSPFHYFGVTDYEKDDVIIEEKTDLSHLVLDERVEFLLEKIDYYGKSGDQTKGLVFCSRVDEARELAEKFNELGIKSTYLSGSDSIEKRKTAVEKLEDGLIKYIFTVDIFNEGIDIPKINQIIMLRSTQSSIIFTQQLGRGLRKHPSKEYVTVIDFIGNYDNNYLIPMALIGDNTFNKDNLRKGLNDVNYISGLSAINFEEVAKERIFKSIDTAKLDSLGNLKKGYLKLKDRLNRIPMLLDFEKNNILDPFILANKKESYYGFLKKVKEIDFDLGENDQAILKFLSAQILPGKRIHEITLVKYMLESGKTITLDESVALYEKAGIYATHEVARSVVRTLNHEYYVAQLQKSYEGGEIVTLAGDRISLTAPFTEAVEHPLVFPFIKDVLDTAQRLSEPYDQSQPLTRYQKYYRRDTLRLLNFENQMVDLNIGGYTYDGERKIFIIFVTLEKGEDFSGAEIAYEDSLLDQSTLRWFTKSRRRLDSPEVKIMLNPEGWNIHVFTKKSDDEGKDFYYLGQVIPDKDSIQQLTRPNKNGNHLDIVEMHLIFKQPIDLSVFNYLSQ